MVVIGALSAYHNHIEKTEGVLDITHPEFNVGMRNIPPPSARYTQKMIL